ncbi:hypothetical protein R0G64_31560, partial [Pseudomonas otitidis]|nr:hypothetical protein [Pseudomonas otitidis]
VAQLFMTNAVAPVRLAERLKGQLRDGGTLAFMSSTLGFVGLAGRLVGGAVDAGVDQDEVEAATFQLAGQGVL